MKQHTIIRFLLCLAALALSRPAAAPHMPERRLVR